jgi:RsiW-degrading membrane proteinase PrsW (M82 family)
LSIVSNSVLFTALYVALSLAGAFLVAGASTPFARARLDGRYISYGMGIFFIGIALHSLIALPVVLIAQGPHGLLPFTHRPPFDFRPWHLIYFAIAAGVGQELSKVIPLSLEMKRDPAGLRARNLGWLGLMVGLGFSASETIVIATSSWQPVMTGLGPANVLIGGLERTSASLFHMGTAAWLGASIGRGRLKSALAWCVALHAVLDSIAGLLKVHTMRGVVVEEAALFVFSAGFFLLAFRSNVRAAPEGA